MRGMLIFAFAALSMSSGASAVPTCGPWVTQTNGTAWRICYDDQKKRFCQVQKSGEIRQMRCP